MGWASGLRFQRDAGRAISAVQLGPAAIVKRKPCNLTIAATRRRPRPTLRCAGFCLSDRSAWSRLRVRSQGCQLPCLSLGLRCRLHAVLRRLRPGHLQGRRQGRPVGARRCPHPARVGPERGFLRHSAGRRPSVGQCSVDAARRDIERGLYGGRFPRKRSGTHHPRVHRRPFSALESERPLLHESGRLFWRRRH